jgi:PAS domain S-box-containing protein
MASTAVIAILAAVYFVTGKLGLKLAVVHASATPVWLPTGISLAALLKLGYPVWPGLFLGAFLVNVTTAGTVATSAGIAMGNTLEGVVGAYLATRFANGLGAFDRTKDIFKFSLLAGLVSTAISPTFGLTSLCLAGHADWSQYSAIWLTWWLGDAAGALIVAPVLILWSEKLKVRSNRKEQAELVLLVLCLILVGEAVFGGWLSVEFRNYPLDFLYLPILVWSASRFGQRETATVAFLLSAFAIWGTMRGDGPFVRATQNESLLLLQTYMGVIAVTAMALAANVAGRKRAERTLRESEARKGAILGSALDCVISMDHEGRIVEFNQAAEDTFGYSRAEAMGKPMADLIIPQSLRERHRRGLEHCLATGEGPILRKRMEMTATRADGAEFPVELAINRVDMDGPPMFTGYVRDITERKRVEKQIQASLREKELLLKEVHHRVKNNMQVISSMLSLQSAYIQDQKSLEVFHESENRIRSIGLIHERFYQSKDLSRIDFGEYMRNLAAHLFHFYGARSAGIRLRINAGNVFMNLDTAIPCGLIINEIVSNSLKYAFPEGNKQGAVEIDLRTDDGKFVLTVGDNGVGLPSELDVRNNKTFGLQLVATLIDQIDGRLEIDRVGGTTFKIEFTDSKYRQGGEDHG